MIATRYMELRKRRGVVITGVALVIGIPTLFLTIRLLLHAFAPRSYGAAGGYDTFDGVTAGVLYLFVFVVAAMLGCTAGSLDRSEGMFRQLVLTGRSRLAIYLARIPAGLAILIPIVAVAFTIICCVCTFSAPTTYVFQGVEVPLGLSETGYQNWAIDHPNDLICDLPFGGPCNGITEPNTPLTRALAIDTARLDYPSYSGTFLYPSVGLMIRTGLWVELEAIVWFILGLGLASLMGQRTLPLVLMIVYELIISPILFKIGMPINIHRAILDFAVDHLEPSALGFSLGPGSTSNLLSLPPEPRIVALAVILAWMVGVTVLGAWRMSTRDV
jgi:hypothetical protein